MLLHTVYLVTKLVLCSTYKMQQEAPQIDNIPSTVHTHTPNLSIGLKLLTRSQKTKPYDLRRTKKLTQQKRLCCETVSEITVEEI